MTLPAKIAELRALCERLERAKSEGRTSDILDFALQVEAALPAALDALEAALAGLETIANHPGQSYELEPHPTPQFSAGVVKGHNACVNIADKALAAAREKMK